MPHFHVHHGEGCVQCAASKDRSLPQLRAFFAPSAPLLNRHPFPDFPPSFPRRAEKKDDKKKGADKKDKKDKKGAKGDDKKKDKKEKKDKE